MFGAAALLAAFAAVGVNAQDKTQRIVRGVNLGGWLVTEPWYVLLGSREASLLQKTPAVLWYSMMRGEAKGLGSRRPGC